MERNAWSGWIGFAGWLMVIIGAVDMFEGIVAIIRQNYYVFTANQIILFNVKTWGWIMLIWGAILALTRAPACCPARAGRGGSRSLSRA